MAQIELLVSQAEAAELITSFQAHNAIEVTTTTIEDREPPQNTLVVIKFPKELWEIAIDMTHDYAKIKYVF